MIVMITNVLDDVLDPLCLKASDVPDISRFTRVHTIHYEYWKELSKYKLVYVIVTVESNLTARLTQGERLSIFI